MCCRHGTAASQRTRRWWSRWRWTLSRGRHVPRCRSRRTSTSTARRPPPGSQQHTPSPRSGTSFWNSQSCHVRPGCTPGGCTPPPHACCSCTVGMHHCLHCRQHPPAANTCEVMPDFSRGYPRQIPSLRIHLPPTFPPIIPMQHTYAMLCGWRCAQRVAALPGWCRRLNSPRSLPRTPSHAAPHSATPHTVPISADLPKPNVARDFRNSVQRPGRRTVRRPRHLCPCCPCPCCPRPCCPCPCCPCPCCPCPCCPRPCCTPRMPCARCHRTSWNAAVRRYPLHDVDTIDPPPCSRARPQGRSPPIRMPWKVPCQTRQRTPDRNGPELDRYSHTTPAVARRCCSLPADDHLNYAVTWAALSACTAFLAVRLLRRGAGPAMRRRGAAAALP